MTNYTKRSIGKKMVLFAAGALFLGILLASCGNSGSYGGGGGYGGMAVFAPMAFTLTSPINNVTTTSLTPDLMWGASTYATGYYVYLKEHTAASYTLIATVAITSFKTSTLTATTAYDWYVTAYNSAGMSTSGVASFTTGT